MAMPASGSIAIISAPQTCGSICAAVGCASGSLTTLSVAAGKTAPHCMREFYGYTPAPALACVSLSSINSCTDYSNIAYCLSELCTVGMGAGQCYVPTISYAVANSIISGFRPRASSSVCLFCNGVCVCGCLNVDSTYESGTFTPLIKYGESWCFCTRASIVATSGDVVSANGCMRISSIQCCVGDYTCCNPYSQQSNILYDL